MSWRGQHNVRATKKRAFQTNEKEEAQRAEVGVSGVEAVGA